MKKLIFYSVLFLSGLSFIAWQIMPRKCEHEYVAIEKYEMFYNAHETSIIEPKDLICVKCFNKTKQIIIVKK